jgi:hypothetical protein
MRVGAFGRAIEARQAAPIPNESAILPIRHRRSDPPRSSRLEAAPSGSARRMRYPIPVI